MDGESEVSLEEALAWREQLSPQERTILDEKQQRMGLTDEEFWPMMCEYERDMAALEAQLDRDDEIVRLLNSVVISPEDFARALPRLVSKTPEENPPVPSPGGTNPGRASDHLSRIFSKAAARQAKRRQNGTT